MALRMILTAALFISASAQAYEVMDTGVLGRNEVYWVDNARILFPGFQRLTASSGSASFRSVIYIWNLDDKRVAIHAEIPDGNYVCFAGGFVSYGIRKGGKRYIREGMLGAEIDREWIRLPPGSKIDRNEFTCKDHRFFTG